MQREAGDTDFPIWLLGDSNPRRWQDLLSGPFDARHPVRHNIWTSVLEEIQDIIYRLTRSRLDTSTLYIRNAVDDPSIKPLPNEIVWRPDVELEAKEFRRLVQSHQPVIVICFGAFAFEFARRALSDGVHRSHGYWRTERLGAEFRQSIQEFSVPGINILPLLHRSISGGHFLVSHDRYCGFRGANYFQFVGSQIANKLLEHKKELHIWL